MSHWYSTFNWIYNSIFRKEIWKYSERSKNNFSSENKRFLIIVYTCSFFSLRPKQNGLSHYFPVIHVGLCIYAWMFSLVFIFCQFFILNFWSIADISMNLQMFCSTTVLHMVLESLITHFNNSSINILTHPQMPAEKKKNHCKCCTLLCVCHFHLLLSHSTSYFVSCVPKSSK